MSDANNSLIVHLFDNGFGNLLKIPEVRKLCTDGLLEAGCPRPANQIIILCLDKIVAFGAGFLGGAFASRLDEWIAKSPRLSQFLTRIASICRKHQDQERLKEALLAELKGGAPPALPPTIDEATDLEILQAVYLKDRFDGLDEGLNSIFALLHGELCRLSNDALGPRLGWPRGSTEALTDRIRYTSGAHPFVGREEDLAFLGRFLGDVSVPGPLNRFRWVLLTGPGGDGKTRLAYEFTRNHLTDNWMGGRLAMADLERFDYAQWVPRKPVCIVIDYPAQNPGRVHAMLANLARRADQFDWPVRVLLLEREAEGSWFDLVVPQNSDGAALRHHVFSDAGTLSERGRPVFPIMPDSIIAMMAKRFADEGLEPPDPQLLIAAAHKVDSRTYSFDEGTLPLPRPLFAAAVAEILIAERRAGSEIDQASVDKLDREGVLKSLIARDRAERWRPIEPDSAKLELHENLLALASFALGVEVNKLGGIDPAVRDLLPDLGKGAAPLNVDLLDRMSDYEMGRIAPLEPDILGEFLVLERLDAMATSPLGNCVKPFCGAALALGGDDAAVFLLRVARDFPGRSRRFDWLLPSSDASRAARLSAVKAMVDLAGASLAPVADLRAWFREAATHEPDDREIALVEAQAAVNVSSDAGGAGDWGLVAEMLARLDALRGAFPDDREIALEEAKAAFNVSSHAGGVGDWGLVTEMLARLDALRGAFADDREIALEEAHAAVNVSSHAGGAGDWGLVAEMLARLDALRGAFADDREIALEEAKAAFNVSNHARRAGDWAMVTTMLARLDALRGAFADDREIALEEAKAAFNVSSDAGGAGDWGLVAEMLARLDALRGAFPDDREIALEEAKAALNVSNHAGSAGDWGLVAEMLARGRQSFDVFNTDAAIVAVLADLFTLSLFSKLNAARPVAETDATMFAWTLGVLANSNLQDDPAKFGFRMTVLKALRGRFGSLAAIVNLFDAFAAAGLDWDQVPDIDTSE